MFRKSTGLENTEASTQVPSVEPKNECPAEKGRVTPSGPTDERVDEGGPTEATTSGPKEDRVENVADAWLSYQPPSPLAEDDSMDIEDIEEDDSMDVDEEWCSSPSSTSSPRDDDDCAMDVDWWCLGDVDVEGDVEMTDCTEQSCW